MGVVRLKRLLCAALEAHMAGERPRPPEGSAVLWNAFLALSRARSVGPAGPNPIAFSEIEAWARLTRTPLEPHHVDILAAMDAVWIGRAYEGGTDKPKAPMSADAFDAFFG